MHTIWPQPQETMKNCKCRFQMALPDISKASPEDLSDWRNHTSSQNRPWILPAASSGEQSL
jgi:hypothetical protein